VAEWREREWGARYGATAGDVKKKRWRWMRSVRTGVRIMDGGEA
jgi:hypothetical protein